jgi:hypothetical protein
VRDGVAELAALVDRPGSLRRGVAGDASGKGELTEEPLQSGLVATDARVDLAVGPLQVGVRDHARATVPGSRDIDGVEVVRPDHPVGMDIDEVETRCGAPVSEQAGLHVRELERFLEQGIVEEVDLADRQVVGGPPVRVQALHLLLAEGLTRLGCGSGSSGGGHPAFSF